MRPLLLAVAVAALGFAPAPFPKSKPSRDPSDLARMQGTWAVVERSLGGRSVLTGPTQIRITGTRFEFIVGGQVRTVWQMKLDATTTTPRTVDRHADGGGTVMRGVYRFDGGRLTFCYSSNGSRPTGFDPGPGAYLMTLQREGR